MNPFVVSWRRQHFYTDASMTSMERMASLLLRRMEYGTKLGTYKGLSYTRI